MPVSTNLIIILEHLDHPLKTMEDRYQSTKYRFLNNEEDVKQNIIDAQNALNKAMESKGLKYRPLNYIEDLYPNFNNLESSFFNFLALHNIVNTDLNNYSIKD